MAHPNGQEYSNETDVDVMDGEPLADSGLKMKIRNPISKERRSRHARNRRAANSQAA